MANTEDRQDLRALIVGLGSMGIRHFENLRRLGCGQVDVFRSRKGPLHKSVDLTGVSVYSNFTEALGQGYDAVVICNPTSLHLSYAQQAAEAGCDLYIEKPLSDTLDNTNELLRTVKDKCLVVSIGCQFRFHPNLTAVKRWLDDGAIGRTLSVQVDTGEYLPGWHPWEDYRKGYAARRDLGGGVVLTMIHEIDYLCWLLGPFKPACSFGGVSNALELDVEDHTLCMFLSEKNVPVVLNMDYLQQPPCRRMKVLGSQGVIEWDYYEGVASLIVDGEVLEESRVSETWGRNDLFLSIMADFLDAVCKGGSPKVPLEDGIETLRIALDIKKQLLRISGVQQAKR